MARQGITPELTQMICAAIRAGGYPHIAAEAAGIEKTLFNEWMRKGKRPQSPKNFRKFYLEVTQAKAHARLRAEMEVAKQDPKAWLRSGPGKEDAESEGWTSLVKPILRAPTTQVNLFTSSEFLGLLALIRQVLAPFPEALEALTTAMDNKPVKAVEVLDNKVIPKLVEGGVGEANGTQ